jgi:vitamin B12 transporter
MEEKKEINSKWLQILCSSRIVWLLLLAFMVQLGYASFEDFDTTITIKEVQITSVRLLDFSAGQKIMDIDSYTLERYHHRNLSDLLSDESGIFIRSYGMGSLATSSFRGGNSGHTALLWNNFAINSPMNGIIDLSLLPVSFFNNVQIQHGGSSSLWGSAAIGGSVHLSNQHSFGSGLYTGAQVNFGSFGNFSQQGQFVYSSQKSITSVNILHQRASNDFSYSNPYSISDEKIRQTNAELLNYGIMADQRFKIRHNQNLNASLWIQKTDRNLPPTMLQAAGRASQQDENYRASVEWNIQQSKNQTFVRAAWFDETIYYNDTIISLFDRNNAKTMMAEAENKWQISSRHSINSGINNTFYMSETGGYPYRPTQNRTAFFAAYQYSSKKLKSKLNLSVRQEIIQELSVPFTASAGYEQQLTKGLFFKALVSRVFRTPTFNDLFWQPRGNTELKPENGFTQDIGILYRHSQKNQNFQTELTVYNRNIKDWIIWIPGPNYWSPRNIMKVWSRGIENNTSYSYSTGNMKLGLSSVAVVSVSQNRVARFANDNSVNKQLIYTPVFNGFFRADIGYKNFEVSYRHNYLSRRYTTSDNSDYLPSFHLGAIYLNYRVLSAHSDVRLFIEIQNLYNSEYQTIRNRPMPPAHFMAGFSFAFIQSPYKNKN